MTSISIKVAFCKNCKGYSSATPVEKKHYDHPEIIDQFFYHGEPWFTLDHKTFERKSQFQNLEVKIVDLDTHRKNDQEYCHCPKTKNTLKKAQISSKMEYVPSTSEMSEIESDIYFKDLYYTYSNFHAQNISTKHSVNSARQF